MSNPNITDAMYAESAKKYNIPAGPHVSGTCRSHDKKRDGVQQVWIDDCDMACELPKFADPSQAVSLAKQYALLPATLIERDALREKCEKQKAALEAVVRESCGRVHGFHCQIKSGGECDCSVGLARDALDGEFVPDPRDEQIRKLREGIEAALGEMPNGLLAKWQRDKVESTLRAALAIGGGA